MGKIKITGFVAVLILFIAGCEIDRCNNINCNDNNPCTIDTCDSNTGTCKYEAKVCPQNQKCSIDTGNCEALGVIDKIEDAIREKLG
ncbi:hypothetical protein J4480_01350 [Candidatus Woesearchaeota archaeon]|nr:hypothetical protein [Candidatus Woesearchaeota archaeon]